MPLKSILYFCVVPICGDLSYWVPENSIARYFQYVLQHPYKGAAKHH